jgi:hyperosmotically inducible protein
MPPRLHLDLPAAWLAACFLVAGCAATRHPERVEHPPPGTTAPGESPEDPAADEAVHPDRKLTFAVRQELLFDPHVRIRDVEVEAKAGTIVLSGTVDSLLAKQRAEEITRTVDGVREVVNRLEVRSYERADRDLLQDVQQALRFDPATAVSDIQVTVDEGVVTLRGKVDSDPHRALAEEITKNVRGVSDVRNELDVGGAPEPQSDEENPEGDAATQGRSPSLP